MEFLHRLLRFDLISKSVNSIKKSSFWALFLLLLILQTPAKAEDHDQLYEKHCQGFVAAPTGVTNDQISQYEEIRALGFHQSSYEGGESLFNNSTYSWNPQSHYASFSLFNAFKTDQEGVFKISGRLTIRSRRYGVSINQGFRRASSPFRRTRLPRINPSPLVFTVLADGFWSNVSGRVCMIGAGNRYFFNSSGRSLPVSVKFSYPSVRTILNSLMNGTVESIETEPSFTSISISAIYDGLYNYTMIEDAKSVCRVSKPDVLDGKIDVLKGDLGVSEGGGVGVCDFYWLRRPLELEWNSECSGSDCSFFTVNDPTLLPNTMSIQNLHCSPKGRVHGLFELTRLWNPLSRFVLTKIVLAGEGEWNETKGQLCMVACKVGVGVRNATEDCGISISMQFPLTLTVESRYLVVGHVQSDKKVNDSMYFKKFTFRGSATADLSHLHYNYTKLDKVEKNCSQYFKDRKKSLEKKPGRKYPNGNYGDLGFDASIKGLTLNKTMYGSAYPFTIGNRFEKYNSAYPTIGNRSESVGKLNVSYNLQFRTPFGYNASQASTSSQEFRSISAEGMYDSQTGSLCMIGCSHVGSDGNMDCEILIHVEYAPTNKFASTERLTGNIKSLRQNGDPLYFKPVKLSSKNVYRNQARRTVWRKDLEIIMGLVSLSFTALFIIAQLLHISKHSNSLPFVSLLMLTVLTLGHMIPLVLNFEALFMNQKEKNAFNSSRGWIEANEVKNVFQSSGGWLEVNEVVVRVMTMVAFLLQLRLLQLAWTARLAAAGEKSAWFWEKKILHLCLPLYIFGGILACFAHWAGHSNSVSVRFLQRSTHHSLWEDFRSYAGLILDGFLLPQVLGNLFWDIRETILVPYFYIGIALARSVPHVYDAYRAIQYIPEYSSSYFYANPDWDLYSTAWDIVIPCGVLLLALLVFLQQRFGGRCIVPRRFRDRLKYQKIPVVDA